MPVFIYRMQAFAGRDRLFIYRTQAFAGRDRLFIYRTQAFAGRDRLFIYRTQAFAGRDKPCPYLQDLQQHQNADHDKGDGDYSLQPFGGNILSQHRAKNHT